MYIEILHTCFQTNPTGRNNCTWLDIHSHTWMGCDAFPFLVVLGGEVWLSERAVQECRSLDLGRSGCKRSKQPTAEEIANLSAKTLSKEMWS